MNGVFVTGTDTNVGKTVASAALAAAWGFGYWKPIQTGAGIDDDSKTVAALAGCAIHAAGVRLPDPVSPHLAAELAGVRIDLREVAAGAPASGNWIVEGAGGLLVPINDDASMADLIALLDLPVVVVARSSLGTINHTRLTVEALRLRNLRVLGVVMSGEPNQDNRKAIETFAEVPVLAELPWLSPLNPAALQAWAASALRPARVPVP